MNDERQFEHTPDPVLGNALRSALQSGDQRAFVARVMARYDAALAEATVPAWEVLARWARPGIAAALVAAVLGGFVVGRSLQSGDSATMEGAFVPTSGPGLAALVSATAPPDASIVLTSLVEPQ
jgi:hypothetical protein